MANQLKMAIIETIITLKKRGWSNRRIARELGIDRGTVARQLRPTGASANAAIVDAGSEPIDDDQKQPVPPSTG